MRIVLASGTFDPIHYGHILHFKEARMLGSRLVVALTNDEGVRREKGPGRPAVGELERRAALLMLMCVSAVEIVADLLTALKRVRPAILVKGCDYTLDSISPEDRAYCEANGIEIRFTTTPKYSSTALLRA